MFSRTVAVIRLIRVASWCPGQPPAGEERRERRQFPDAGSAPDGGVHPGAVEVQEHRLHSAARVDLRTGPVRLDQGVVAARGAVDPDGVEPGSLGHVGQGGVAAAGQRRLRGVQERGVGVRRADHLGAVGPVDGQGVCGALADRADHITLVQPQGEVVRVDQGRGDRGRVGAPFATAVATAGVERILRQGGEAADHHVVVAIGRHREDQPAGERVRLDEGVVVEGQDLTGCAVDHDDGVEFGRTHRAGADAQAPPAGHLEEVEVARAVRTAVGAVTDACSGCGRRRPR